MLTKYSKLILPQHSNHRNTLYGGDLFQIALEASYLTACDYIGPQANIVIRRALNIECYQTVKIGTVIKITGQVLAKTATYITVGLLGDPLENTKKPWMESIMIFAQVGDDGQSCVFPVELPDLSHDCSGNWEKVYKKHEKLRRLNAGIDE